MKTENLLPMIPLAIFLAMLPGTADARLQPDKEGEEELARFEDPSFESVSEHFPPMKRPREAIGVKTHRDEFVILPDGRLNFMPVRVDHWRGHTPENSGHVFFTKEGTDTWLGKPGSAVVVRKRLLDGYLPIVFADIESAPKVEPGLKYEQTAVSWSEGMSPDKPLWAFVRLKISNPADRARDVRLAWCADFGDGKARKVREVVSWELHLAPGAEETVYGKLPVLDGYERAGEGSAEEFDKRLEEASSFWKELLNKGIRIETPERRVNDAYRAWLAYTFLNVDKIDGIYEPHDGSGFYEDVFGIMAAKYCNALGLMGYPDEARTFLDSLATMISPEGRFFVSFGFVDTGVLLWVMDRHYQLTGDEEWLRKAVPDMIRMCDWIIGQRNQSKAEQEKDSLTYGLILSRVGVDNPGEYYSYVTDSSLCVGMEAAVRSLRAAGMTEEAGRIAKESEAYRADIERSMIQAVIKDKGMKILPVMPDTHKYLKRAAYKTHVEAGPGEGYTGHGYYALFGSIVLETKFLPATDESFRLIADLLEKRDGLLMSMCAFGRHGGIDHAFTYGYWMNCLERGEVERVLLGFYGSLAYGMSRDTWAGVECTNMYTGENAKTLPHLRSGTQQLRLLRHMLIREDGDRLILAQAVPQHWLVDGKKVSVREAPTHFGKAGYEIESRAGDGVIEVKLDPPTRTPPKTIVIHLRHPEKAKIRGVSTSPEAKVRFSDGAVTLDGVTSPTRIEVRYH